MHHSRTIIARSRPRRLAVDRQRTDGRRSSPTTSSKQCASAHHESCACCGARARNT